MIVLWTFSTRLFVSGDTQNTENRQVALEILIRWRYELNYFALFTVMYYLIIFFNHFMSLCRFYLVQMDSSCADKSIDKRLALYSLHPKLQFVLAFLCTQLLLRNIIQIQVHSKNYVLKKSKRIVIQDGGNINRFES